MTCSRFICTASRPTSIASSTSFLAIFCTPSRNSLEVRDAEGLRSRASWTAANSLSSESVIGSDYPYSSPIMPNKRSRTMTKGPPPQDFCADPRIAHCQPGVNGQLRQAAPEPGPSGCEGGEKRLSIDAAGQRIDQVFRMRHQAEDIEPAVEHAGYGVHRAVRIRPVRGPPLSVAIAEGDPPLGLDSADRVIVGD